MKRYLGLLFVVSLFISACGGDDGGGQSCSTTTPPPPDVGGTWLLSNAFLGDSTCSAEIDDILLEVIGALGGACEVDVEQAGNFVTLTDCASDVLSGCVDSAGVITAPQFASESESGCTVTIDGDLVADSGRSPSTAVFTLPIRFSGNCGGAQNCQAEIEADWTEIVAGQGGSGASTGSFSVRMAAERLSRQR